MPPGRMETPNRLAPNVARIRVLSGLDGGGQITAELRPGRNILGRGDDCDVQLQSDGLSVHHAAITISQGGGGCVPILGKHSFAAAPLPALSEAPTGGGERWYASVSGGRNLLGAVSRPNPLVEVVFAWAPGQGQPSARFGIDEQVADRIARGTGDDSFPLVQLLGHLASLPRLALCLLALLSLSAWSELRSPAWEAAGWEDATCPGCCRHAEAETEAEAAAGPR